MKITMLDKSLTVCLEGEIDHHSARYMREEIDRAVERHKPAILVLDFAGVTFMDSSGIGLVIGRYRLMNLYDGIVKIQNTPPYIHRVMKLAGVGRISLLEGDEEITNEQISINH